jgi:hypothetical protein
MRGSVGGGMKNEYNEEGICGMIHSSDRHFVSAGIFLVTDNGRR